MNNFALNLVKRGAGIEHSQIFRPARPAIFSPTLNNPLLIHETTSHEQIDSTEPDEALEDQKDLESQFSEKGKPLSSHAIDPSAPDFNAMGAPKKSEFKDPVPLGLKYPANISVPNISAGSTSLREDSKQLPEDRFSPTPSSNGLHSKISNISSHDSSHHLADPIDAQIGNKDLITLPDSGPLNRTKPQDQASNFSIKAMISPKIVRIFQESSEIAGHGTPKEVLAQPELINVHKREVPGPPMKGPVLIRPALSMESSPSGSSQASSKGPGIEGEHTVKVRIGTIEVRAVNSSSNSSPPPISLPKGFDEYYMVRNYLNQ